MAGSPVKRERRERAQALLAHPDLWDTLWKWLADGKSLRQFCAEREIPVMTLHSRMAADPELQSRYEGARRARASHHAEEIEKLIEDVQAGRIEAKAGKVAIEARAWLATRMDPRLWSERQQIDVKHTHTGQLHLEAIRELSARRALVRGAQGEVIDAELVVQAALPAACSSSA